jgi:hypothetical protein
MSDERKEIIEHLADYCGCPEVNGDRCYACRARYMLERDGERLAQAEFDKRTLKAHDLVDALDKKYSPVKAREASDE